MPPQQVSTTACSVPKKSPFQALVLALTSRECDTTVETRPVPSKNRMTHACTNTCFDPSAVSVRSDIRVAPAAMFACTRKTQSVHWYSRSQTAKRTKPFVLTTCNNVATDARCRMHDTCCPPGAIHCCWLPPLLPKLVCTSRHLMLSAGLLPRCRACWPVPGMLPSSGWCDRPLTQLLPATESTRPSVCYRWL